MKRITLFMLVLLLLVFGFGCSELWNKPPVAMATVINEIGFVPLEVILSATRSYDPDGKIKKYEWLSEEWYAEGYTIIGTREESMHTYYRSGTYRVYLCVTDDDGAESCTDPITVTVFVYIGENIPPYADYIAEWVNRQALKVKFDARNSYDPDGWITQYCWTVSWQSSSMAEGITIIPVICLSKSVYYHTFDWQGKYVVTLEVTDNRGASDSQTKRWEIYRYNSELEAVQTGE